MGKCINCGKDLNSFNTSYPLWDGTNDKFCTRCSSKFQNFRDKYHMTQASSNQYIAENENVLSSMGFTQSGIKHLKQYADYCDQKKDFEAEREKEEAEQKSLAAELKKEADEKNKMLAEKARKAWVTNSHSFMETTGYSFDGYKIKEYLGVRSGEVVLGTGFLSEFSAGFSDLFGAKSEAMADKLTQAKDAALARLKESCLKVNANAVIGVDLDISIMGQNMILACANGTAVRIEKE